MLHPHRYFDPDPATRKIALDLYTRVETLPLVCPHGHVDPKLLATNEPFPDPSTLLIVPDHYVTRMLYSQGSWASRASTARPSRPPPAASGSCSPITSTCIAARRPAPG
jgi:glucuronate isomerase